MNENKNDNFKDLKRLLKLKRHEIPPPGFFNQFSDEIISRIRAGESLHNATFAERLQDKAPWLINFIRLFEARPGLIGGVATGLCLLLVLGVVLAEQADSSPKTFLTVNSQPAESVSLASSAVSAPVSMADPLFASGIAISSNPVTSLQPVASAFGQPNAGSLFQPANFAPGH
jgi:hypothetical protein